MAKIALLDHLMGNLGPSDFFKVDTTQRFPAGIQVRGVDVLNIFGKSDFMYMQAAGTISANQICVYADAFQVSTAPNTANTGRGVVVSKQDMTVGQWGWFQVTGGMIPVKAVATVAAGSAVGIDATTGGSVNANSAGRQLLGATSLRASAATRVTLGQTKRVSKELRVQSTAGLFVGQAVSGTGIPGGTVVTGFGPDDNTVLVNNTMTVTGSATITFTNTGFIEVAAPQGMILQGAIT